MPYQNTGATPSIQNQYYNWQYFSHGMAKLQGIKPAGVNISPGQLNVDEYNNWAGMAMDFFLKGGQAYSKWQTEESTKEAQKYLTTHTLEEYQKDYVGQNLPFQDDPIAMYELKKGHGKLAFQLAKQEWDNRVKSGEFAPRQLEDGTVQPGLSAEAMDAEYFKFVRGRQKEVANMFGYDEQDDAFTKGYYELSPAARVELANTNAAVTHQQMLQKNLLQGMTELNSAALNGNADVAYDALVNFYNSERGKYVTPEQWDNLLVSMANTLASSNARSQANLEAFGNKKLGDTPIKKILAGSWKKLIDTAQEYEFYNNVRAVREREDLKRDLVNAGNVEDCIRQRTLAEKYSPKGIVSKEWEYWNRAIDEAQAQRDRLDRKEATERQARMKAVIKANGAQSWVESMCKGENTLDYILLNDPETGIEITRKDLKECVARMLENKELTLQQLLDGALNRSGGDYNPMRDHLSNIFTGVLRDFNKDLGDLQSTNALVNLEVPQHLNILTQAYNLSPGAVEEILRGKEGVNPNTEALLEALATADRYNISYSQAIRARKAYIEQGKSRDGHWSQVDTRQRIHKIIDKLGGSAEDTARMTTKVYAKMSLGFTEAQAIDKTREEFEETTFKTHGISIGNKFNIDNNFAKTDFENAVGARLSEIEHAFGGKDSVLFVYSYANNFIRVLDATNLEQYAIIDAKEMNTYAKEWVKKQIYDEKGASISGPNGNRNKYGSYEEWVNDL